MAETTEAEIAVPDEAAEAAAEIREAETPIEGAVPGAQDTPPTHQMACVTAIIPMGTKLGTV